ncbi:unnamed protein product [Trichobilharzia regenti]|nr:unnamed protein product [Trichobilharzia regenti]
MSGHRSRPDSLPGTLPVNDADDVRPSSTSQDCGNNEDDQSKFPCFWVDCLCILQSSFQKSWLDLSSSCHVVQNLRHRDVFYKPYLPPHF